MRRNLQIPVSKYPSVDSSRGPLREANPLFNYENVSDIHIHMRLAYIFDLTSEAIFSCFHNIVHENKNTLQIHRTKYLGYLFTGMDPRQHTRLF